MPLVPARLAPHKHLVYNLSSKSWYSGQQKYIASLLCIENSCLVLKNCLKVDHQGFDVNVSSFPPWEGFSKLRENQEVQLQQTMVNLQYEINTLLETNNLPLTTWDAWKAIPFSFLGNKRPGFRATWLLVFREGRLQNIRSPNISDGFLKFCLFSIPSTKLTVGFCLSVDGLTAELVSPFVSHVVRKMRNEMKLNTETCPTALKEAHSLKFYSSPPEMFGLSTQKERKFIVQSSQHHFSRDELPNFGGRSSDFSTTPSPTHFDCRGTWFLDTWTKIRQGDFGKIHGTQEML